MSTHHSLVLSTASDLGSSEVFGAEEWEGGKRRRERERMRRNRRLVERRKW